MEKNNADVITTFTALDFETANGYRNSICQVGIVQVVKRRIVKQESWFIMPPHNFYWDWFTRDIHGISAETTADKPTFDLVWPDIAPYVVGQHLVAHNSVFDFGCLHATLLHYGLDIPKYDGHCTFRMLGSSLASLCREYHIALNHHDALSDARACAMLFLIAQDSALIN